MSDKPYSGVVIGGPLDGKFMAHKEPRYRIREKQPVRHPWVPGAEMLPVPDVDIHHYTHQAIWRGSNGDITAWLHQDVKGAHDALNRLVARYAEPRADKAV